MVFLSIKKIIKNIKKNRPPILYFYVFLFIFLNEFLLIIFVVMTCVRSVFEWS